MSKKKTKRRGASKPDTGGEAGGESKSSRWSMRPSRLVYGAICLVAFGSIAVNALFLQADRHPAPFFAKNVEASQKVSQIVRKEAQAPARRSKIENAKKQNTGTAVATIPASRVVGNFETPRADSVIVRQPGPAGDLIGSLIKGEGAGISQPSRNVRSQRNRPGGLDTNKTFGLADADRKRIAAMQKALVKLGYPLTVDGLSGPATRQALEKFQRKNRLPSTGRPGGKTLQVLASRSRIAIP